VTHIYDFARSELCSRWFERYTMSTSPPTPWPTVDDRRRAALALGFAYPVGVHAKLTEAHAKPGGVSYAEDLRLYTVGRMFDQAVLLADGQAEETVLRVVRLRAVNPWCDPPPAPRPDFQLLAEAAVMPERAYNRLWAVRPTGRAGRLSLTAGGVTVTVRAAWVVRSCDVVVASDDLATLAHVDIGLYAIALPDEPESDTPTIRSHRP
jgi:hypothetical protein